MYAAILVRTSPVATAIRGRRGDVVIATVVAVVMAVATSAAPAPMIVAPYEDRGPRTDDRGPRVPRGFAPKTSLLWRG